MASTANKTNGAAPVKAIAALLDEHQGEGTVVLDLAGECGFADYFIITTAHSARHLASLVSHVREYLQGSGLLVFNKQKPAGEAGWFVLDCGYFVVHVMEKAERSFYELEKLWFRSRTLPYSSKSS